MPYIEPGFRTKFHPETGHLALRAEDAGELTYCLTVVATSYLKCHHKRFITICIIMGSFLCAALEFYRRVAAPYEDTKIQQNGDVY